MSDRLDSPLPAHKAPGEEWIVVRDDRGREHRVPLRPDGAYITALREGATRRDERATKDPSAG